MRKNNKTVLQLLKKTNIKTDGINKQTNKKVVEIVDSV